MKNLMTRAGAALMAFGPLSVFAQDGGTAVTPDASLTGIDVAAGLSSLGSTLASGITAALGLAVGCWGVLLLWKKIKSAAT